MVAVNVESLAGVVVAPGSQHQSSSSSSAPAPPAESKPPTPLSTKHLYAALSLPRQHLDTIRLLDLQPCAKDRRGRPIANSPLVGRLRTARLGESPCFTTLSYVWGEKSVPSDTITCSVADSSASQQASSSRSSSPSAARAESGEHASDEGVFTLEITTSCHAALRQTRNKFGAVTIWVDSICMNQEDDAEKSTQIPLMKDIYAWATTTYIWLGQGTPDSDVAMDYFHRCGIIMGRLPVSWISAIGESSWKREKEKFFSESIWDCARRLGLLLTPGLYRRVTPEAINTLLDRDWVHRVWTFQEVILSANPVLLCGDRVLGWDRFINVLYCSQEDAGMSDFFQRLLLRQTRVWSAETPGVPSSSQSSLKRWRHLVELWINMPRETLWNGVIARKPLLGEREETELGLNWRARYLWLTSFSENAYALISRREHSRNHRKPLLTFIGNMAGILLLYGLPLLLTDWGNYETWHGNWAFYYLWICLPLYLQRIVGLVVNFTDCVAVGLPHMNLLAAEDPRTLDNLRQGANSAYYDYGTIITPPKTMTITERKALAGVNDALWHRQSLRLHDRAFALDGILASFGVAATSRPDYEEPYGTTFRALFQRLVAWKPDAIAMLADAGTGGGDKTASAPGAPSWVPRWGGGYNGPSVWLTSRYPPGSPCPIPAASHGDPPPSMDGRVLKLRAARCGTVWRRYCFRDHGDNHAEGERGNIYRMLEFIREFAFCMESGKPASYDFPGGRAFGVASGLTPKRVKRDLRDKEWQWPYDLSDHREDYMVFTRIYEFLNCDRWRRRGSDGLRKAAAGEGKAATSGAGQEDRMIEQTTTRVAQGTEVSAGQDCDDDAALFSLLGSTIKGSHALLARLGRELASQERCLFLSRDGQVGSGPSMMSTGTDVFLLQGVPVPMALRAVTTEDKWYDRTYTTVGAVLLHGMMDGEPYMSATNDIRIV